MRLYILILLLSSKALAGFNGHVSDAPLYSTNKIRFHGWACQINNESPIRVQIYVGGDKNTGTKIYEGLANSSSEDGVRRACMTEGSNAQHRFRFDLDFGDVYPHKGKEIYAYAVDPVNPNNLWKLYGSGSKRVANLNSWIHGKITQVAPTSDGGTSIRGYACQTYLEESIKLHLYFNGPAGQGSYFKQISSNINSSSGVYSECKTIPNTTPHSFYVKLTASETLLHNGKTLFMHGISPLGTGNNLIGESGKFTIQAPSPPQELLGSIKKINRGIDGVTVEGWSCQSFNNQQNTVKIYSKKNGALQLLATTPANLNIGNPNDWSQCSTNGVARGFKSTINSQTILDYDLTNTEIVVEAVKVDSNVSANSILANPSNLKFPSTVLQRLSDIASTGNMLMIDSRQEVIMYGNYDLGMIHINGGTLRCTTGGNNITLRTTGIHVKNSGKFQCGSSSSPHVGKFDIKLKNSSMSHPMHLMAESGGEISLHGKDTQKKWSTLTGHAEPGAYSISVEDNMGVKINDTIIIASTSFDYSKSEERIVSNVNGNRIYFDVPLQHFHIGQTKQYHPSFGTRTLNMRANVAVIDRNIYISPADSNQADSSKIGGDIMIMNGAKAFLSSVHLDRMGKMGQMGRYPFHWHIAGNVSGQYIKNSSITNSFNRCVVIHSTMHALVQNNVCYNHFGHGYFLESGNETENIIRDNIGIHSKRVPQNRALLFSEYKSKQNERFEAPATFWISNPKNTIENNIAAGYEGTGFWMSFNPKLNCQGLNCTIPDSGPGTSPGNYFPNREPTISFKDNTAYSGVIGFTWDGAPSGIKTNNKNEQGEIINPDDRETLSSHYFGFSPNTRDKVINYKFNNLTTFRNINTGIYYRGTRATFNNFKGADNGVTIFTAYNQIFTNSLVVGESPWMNDDERVFRLTKNNWNHGAKGKYYHKKIKGFVTYDGPTILSNILFAGFPNQTTKLFDLSGGFHRDAVNVDITPSAIHLFGGSTHYEHQISGIEFEEDPYFKVNFHDDKNDGWMDAINHTRIRDLDGSITGVANSLIVPTTPILNDTSCIDSNPDSNYSVCPYDLGVFWLRKGGAFDFIAWRDDQPSLSQYGPLSDTHMHNNKIGLIIGNNSYSVEINRSRFSVDGVATTFPSSVPLVFEHKALNTMSPKVKLINTSDCLLDYNGHIFEATSEANFYNSNQSAYFRDGKGDINIKLKTLHSVDTNHAAYRSNQYNLKCTN